MASGEKVKFLLSGKLIQQIFDYPLCLAKALSPKLSLRAVHCLCELWIFGLYRAFLFPGHGGEAADSTFSSLYPSSSIPPSPSVLFTLCSPAAVPPRRHSRPPRPWRPASDCPVTALTMGTAGREVLEWVGEWCWQWLSGGDFFFMVWRVKVWLHMAKALTLKIYRCCCIVWPGDLFRRLFYWEDVVPQFLLADWTVTFSLSSGVQEAFIPSYLNFLRSHECNGRCYFWHSEKTGGRSRWPNNVPGFFPELRSPSAGWQPALVSFSQSAVMSWFAQNYTAYHKKNSIMTSIFAWVVPFTSLNSVTASSCECKIKFLGSNSSSA